MGYQNLNELIQNSKTSCDYFYYLPVKILQQYDSYNLTELNVTKESNGYLVKVDLELIKEEKSKNHSITIKIQMDHKKFTYFTITEGKEI